jgi:hypothetical protein
MTFLAPRGERVITDPGELRQAVIDAFVDGDPATCQHIVDTLGAQARPAPAETDPIPADRWVS